MNESISQMKMRKNSWTRADEDAGLRIKWIRKAFLALGNRDTSL